MAQSRHVFIKVDYDGKNITEAVSDSLISLQYVDKASNEADDLMLEFHDRENNWNNDWYPKAHVITSEKSVSDYSAMASVLQKGASVEELQKLIDKSDLSPEQGQALQTITDSANWPEYKKANPQYAGESGKLQLIYDIKGEKPPAAGVDNAVKGTILRVKICVENWDIEGDYDELDCGAFEIDTVDFSGPPDIASIKALSTPISTGMRRQEKSRSWEDTTLQKIAQDIAFGAGLKLMYEVESNIQLDRIDQLEKSDMAFLQELCIDYGVSLKVTDNTVVLFEESVYESKEVIATYDKKETSGRLLEYHFIQSTGDTVYKVISSYKDPKSGQLIEAEFTPPEPPATGQVAKINKRPGDLRGDNFREGNDTSSEAAGGTHDTGFNAFNDITADFKSVRSDTTPNAERQARAVAREKNKKEWTCTLNLLGNVKIIGGVNIQLNGFGVYSGKYSIDEATHSVVGGYLTMVKAHRVLVGY